MPVRDVHAEEEREAVMSELPELSDELLDDAAHMGDLVQLTEFVPCSAPACDETTVFVLVIALVEGGYTPLPLCPEHVAVFLRDAATMEPEIVENDER